jgi:hypothetical protein
VNCFPGSTCDLNRREGLKDACFDLSDSVSQRLSRPWDSIEGTRVRACEKSLSRYLVYLRLHRC